MRPCGMPPAGRAAHARSQGSKRWIPDQVRDDSPWDLGASRTQDPKPGPTSPRIIPAPEPGSISPRVIPASEPGSTSHRVIPAPEPGSTSPHVIPASEPGSICQRGFTLIEVLVALGITAVALMAGLQATGSLSRNAERQTVTMLGQICADNQLIALRLRRQLPDTGNTSVECTQAGRLLQVEVSVRPTPNPNFRRVDARVLDQGAYVLQVSTVMGRN
jgi:general secretion pathway protein I